MKLTNEQQLWLDNQLAKSDCPVRLDIRNNKEGTNPCIVVFGEGPQGVKCKTCDHLFRKHYSHTFIKCDLRPDTNGPATDHKAGWPACARYKPIVTDQP